MNGPLDEIGQTLAKGDTVVLCFDGQHYAAQVVDIKEPSLITSVSAGGTGRAAAGMGMSGVVTLAIMPMSIMFTAQAPKVKCLKIQPPKPPGGQA